MVFQCDACHRIYEVNLTGVTCICCGAHRCHPYEPKQKEESAPSGE